MDRRHWESLVILAMSQRPQLDPLRGTAAALVVFHHWTPWGNVLGLGNIGVQLFFVLSGFLISGVLHDQRSLLEAGGITYRSGLRTFFVRCAARIWPVMFLTLALVWLAGDRFERRTEMLWHALFGSNVLFFARGEFESSLAHLWSLAVEQQFHLVWPFLMLFAPRKWLEPITVVSIVVSPLTRLALARSGYTHFAQYNVLPFANLDSLGVGALTALWRRLSNTVAEARRVLNALKAQTLSHADGEFLLIDNSSKEPLAERIPYLHANLTGDSAVLRGIDSTTGKH